MVRPSSQRQVDEHYISLLLFCCQFPSQCLCLIYQTLVLQIGMESFLMEIQFLLLVHVAQPTVE